MRFKTMVKGLRGEVPLVVWQACAMMKGAFGTDVADRGLVWEGLEFRHMCRRC